MEDNIQESITSENFPTNISQNNINKKIVLSEDDTLKSITSHNILEKKGNEEVKEIQKEIEKKEGNNNELNQNIINNEKKENKQNPLIEKLLNIHKLIKKDLSTRKICKYNNKNNYI